MPRPTVQVLLDDGTGTWQHDVSKYVNLRRGISITRGRQDGFGEVQPSTCSLTLDNSTGIFKQSTVAKPNLLGNGSFEMNTAGWFISTGITQLVQTSAQATVGSKSMAIYCAGGGVAEAYSHRFPIAEGFSHAVMASFRAATTVRTCTVAFLFWDAAGNALATSAESSGVDATGTWLALQRTPVAPPAGAVEGAVRVRVVAPVVGEVHYLDAVYATPYAFTGADVYTDPSLPVRVDTGLKVRTTVNGVTTDRFTGYVQTWPVEWPGGSSYTETKVSATDRLARLARRKLRSPMENAILLAAPSAYYVLSEAAGATTAGDSSGFALPAVASVQRGVGGTLEFGTGTGPAKDGHTAATFTRASGTDGIYLGGTCSGSVVNSSSWWVRCAVSTSSAAAQQTLVNVIGTDGRSGWLGVAAGRVQAIGHAFTATGGTTNIADGLVHDVVVVLDAATTTAYLYLDGVLETSAAYSAPWVLKVASFTIGGAVSNHLADATLSHVAFGAGAPSAGTVADWYTAGSDGFVADSSDERIARYAAWAKVPTADLSLEAGSLTSVAHVDTTGKSPVESMQAVAAAEQGLLFVDGAGLLVLHSRTHRYAPTAAVTLAAGEIGRESSFSLDAQQLVNSVTASREGGASQLYEVASSIRKYEQYPDSLTLPVTTDDEALQAAAWRANTNSEPSLRLSSVPVDLLTQTAATAAAVQAMELGDALTLTGLPSQVDSSTTLFAEGWTEEIAAEAWSMTFNTSPLITVWTLEDPVSGFIDRTFRLAY